MSPPGVALRAFGDATRPQLPRLVALEERLRTEGHLPGDVEAALAWAPPIGWRQMVRAVLRSLGGRGGRAFDGA